MLCHSNGLTFLPTKPSAFLRCMTACLRRSCIHSCGLRHVSALPHNGRKVGQGRRSELGQRVAPQCFRGKLNRLLMDTAKSANMLVNSLALVLAYAIKFVATERMGVSFESRRFCAAFAVHTNITAPRIHAKGRINENRTAYRYASAQYD